MVERSAMTRAEVRENAMPAAFSFKDTSTRNLPPPKRGCHY